MRTRCIISLGLTGLFAACFPAIAQEIPPAKTTAIRAGQSAKRMDAKPRLPACPAGVTHVEWNQFFKSPVGAGGLEMTDIIQRLNGKKVRLLGYMVRREEPVAGVLLLAPMPASIEEHEEGIADLPPQTVRVLLSHAAGKQIPYTPRPLLLTGTLSVGRKEDVSETLIGEVSWFRLTLDTPPVKSKTVVKQKSVTITATNKKSR